MIPKSLPLFFIVAAVTACAEDRARADDPAMVAPSQGREEAPVTPVAAPVSIEIVPGERVGPVRIGMSREALEQLGLQPHPRFSAMTIPVSAALDADGRVVSARVSLGYSESDIRIGGVTLPRDANLATIRSLLGDCTEVTVARGGRTHLCRDGAIRIMIGGGDPQDIWLETRRAG